LRLAKMRSFSMRKSERTGAGSFNGEGLRGGRFWRSMRKVHLSAKKRKPGLGFVEIGEEGIVLGRS